MADSVENSELEVNFVKLYSVIINIGNVANSMEEFLNAMGDFEYTDTELETTEKLEEVMQMLNEILVLYVQLLKKDSVSMINIWGKMNETEQALSQNIEKFNFDQSIVKK